ncbi:MAG TPA: PepSY-like domain-containing protein [Cyclobacteriaceae bacterium]|nr:PepSY-like domain-containing protein [Cyclobacteriaceae bacterium]
MKLLASTIVAFSMMGCSLVDNDIPASKVPSVVKNAFEQQYANAVDIDWEKKKDNFEVDFEIANVDYAALYNKQGQLMMTKEDISTSQLPTAVADKIAQDYPDYYIDDADKITVGDRILYQVELEGNVRERKLVYTADGEQDSSFSYWD